MVSVKTVIEFVMIWIPKKLSHFRKKNKSEQFGFHRALQQGASFLLVNKFARLFNSIFDDLKSSKFIIERLRKFRLILYRFVSSNCVL